MAFVSVKLQCKKRGVFPINQLERGLFRTRLEVPNQLHQLATLVPSTSHQDPVPSQPAPDPPGKITDPASKSV